MQDINFILERGPGNGNQNGNGNGGNGNHNGWGPAAPIDGFIPLLILIALVLGARKIKKKIGL